MARWKRGSASQGVKQAIAYAFNGVCDQTLTARDADGVIAAAGYADALMVRYSVEDGSIRDDLLTRDQLKIWVDGADPLTGERRGRVLESPTADLILDATVNAPKSFSVAAMLHPEINQAFEALQDRLRDRIIRMWQQELNARRGAGGLSREAVSRIEVVELRHERSRSLDPHKHRHLWLNVRAQGADGRWSNIDTRVALRFQTLVNAEGDLAARTDPEWIQTLAAHGYTLDADGEIAQLTHLVRPLSRRSAQIEANKTARTAWWKEAHPGAEPDRDVLKAIDRWAWATGRPDKTHDFDEDEWVDNVRAELASIDPTVEADLMPLPVASVRGEDLDLDLLAARAVADADRRSTGTGGRFSRLDVRAGAVRALAGSGFVGDREQLDAVIANLIERVMADFTTDLLNDTTVPAHVKSLAANSTITAKAALDAAAAALTADGQIPDQETITRAAATSSDRALDRGQMQAARLLAGTDRIVAISGPAGTGKTTMLRAAAIALRADGRRMVVVAPTKKASTVAGREAAVDASSLHQLLHDYGWRWTPDDTGRTRWTRLYIGDTDPQTGWTYKGPTLALSAQARLVVDEAGMLDLDAALALMHVVRESGCSLAVVGDQYQALPVGHAGAMALLAERATRETELTAVHRFTDSAWAETSLLLRRPLNQEKPLADALFRTGHARSVNGFEKITSAMVDGWFASRADHQSIALIMGSNREAQAVSEAIQAKRISRGDLKTDKRAAGQGDQQLLVGDVVQTRRNDSRARVDNRDLWVITGINNDSLNLASTNDSTRLRTISRDYAARYAHLGYATTVHGIQGETADRSIVGPGVDHAGLYVGLTRGRHSNTILLNASSEETGRNALEEILHEPVFEPSVDASRLAAAEDLRRANRGVRDRQPQSMPQVPPKPMAVPSGLGLG